MRSRTSRAVPAIVVLSLSASLALAAGRSGDGSGLGQPHDNVGTIASVSDTSVVLNTTRPGGHNPEAITVTFDLTDDSHYFQVTKVDKPSDAGLVVGSHVLAFGQQTADGVATSVLAVYNPAPDATTTPMDPARKLLLSLVTALRPPKDGGHNPYQAVGIVKTVDPLVIDKLNNQTQKLTTSDTTAYYLISPATKADVKTDSSVMLEGRGRREGNAVATAIVLLPAVQKPAAP